MYHEPSQDRLTSACMRVTAQQRKVSSSLTVRVKLKHPEPLSYDGALVSKRAIIVVNGWREDSSPWASLASCDLTNGVLWTTLVPKQYTLHDGVLVVLKIPAISGVEPRDYTVPIESSVPPRPRPEPDVVANCCWAAELTCNENRTITLQIRCRFSPVLDTPCT